MACGFGGGLMHKDLCGFLTSGIMALGLYAGMQQTERAEGKKLCSKSSNQYWDWWTSMAPIHCSEIRTEGTSRKTCMRLGQLAAAKVEELIKSAKTVS